MRATRNLRSALAAALTTVLAASFLVFTDVAVAPAPEAAAASASAWDPGYIIDDQIFYDSTSMSSSEIQSFLNNQVRTCRSGFTCVKDYAQSTDNRPADRYCNGYSGTGRETAAQIIDKVARSCDINQRVLITLLQKEQGLITDSAPSAWSYSAATGQGCPDTAPCDSATSGFFYQVYYGARQFQIYRLNPNSFGFREQRWNNILLNPDASCGTQRVFIQNQATAALYIYTPYTPNAAALANLYGSGDRCSAYGNRNFWRIYTDWFGDPHVYTVHPGFASYYNSQGGESGAVGKPRSYPVYIEANGQGWYQDFAGGTLYGSFWGGTVFVARNVILTEYNRQGGPASGMGWPTGAQMCTLGARCAQSFLSASITTTAQYGAHVIWGGMDSYWRSGGSIRSALGAALNDVTYAETASGPGWVQNFELGVLVQSQYGFQVVQYGSIQKAWTSTGAGSGWLGWPRNSEECTSAGCAQSFRGGIVTSEPTWGTHGISGEFASVWEVRNGLRGLGAAVNDLNSTTANGGGSVQNFTAGVLARSSSGTFLVPYGRSQSLWTSSGGQQGSLGWPEAEQTCITAGCGQNFQGGAVTESTWGAFATFGGLGGAWRSGGGMASYGPAINDIRYSAANRGGWVQHFGNGVITEGGGSAPIFTRYGPILATWYGYGAENTWLGWPAGVQTCDANGCIQQFQSGAARSDASGKVTFIPR